MWSIQSIDHLLCSVGVIGFQFLLGLVYIPPESSRFSSIKLFDDLELESDIVNLSVKGNKLPVCIGRDFNAWTGRKPDYITSYDNDVTLNVGHDENIFHQIVNMETIDTLGFELQRNSSHNATNNYGLRLIQMCKNLDLYIANGRLVGYDRYYGRPTCKNSSVVDYFIMSPEMMPFVLKFEIAEFDITLSDVHNPILLSFYNNNTDPSKTTDSKFMDVNLDMKDDHNLDNVPSFVKPRWNASMEIPFLDNIDVDQIMKTEAELDQFLLNPESIDSIMCNRFSN